MSLLARALRGGRGPAPAPAMALGRRVLGDVRPSLVPPSMTTTRYFASGNGNGNGNGGMGAACTACSKDAMDLRAEMLHRHHSIWARCIQLGDDNADIRFLLVENRSRAHVWVVEITFAALATGAVATLSLLAVFMKPILRDWWTEEDGGGTVAIAKFPKEEDGGRKVAKLHKEDDDGTVAKLPKEEAGSGTVAKLPKEEAGSGTVAKLPKEEEGGGTVAKLPKEEDGSGTVAKFPMEEDGGGRLAKLPKEVDGGGTVAK